MIRALATVLATIALCTMLSACGNGNSPANKQGRTANRPQPEPKPPPGADSDPAQKSAGTPAPDGG